jgi:putative cryptic C4-dicarboxylate transporter dcuD
MDLIIGLVAIVLVAYYIVKGYSATGVLMFGGLVLLLLSVLMGHSILPENVKSTGSTYLDIIEYVKYLLSNRSGGLGLMIWCYAVSPLT